LFFTGELSERFHHPPTQITVEIIVRREHGDIVLMNDRACLEIWNAHGDAEFLGFITARDYASVVVAEYHNGTVAEFGHEQPFTGAVKTVAIDDGFHVSEWMT
jgi:hypothetical protein